MKYLFVAVLYGMSFTNLFASSLHCSASGSTDLFIDISPTLLSISTEAVLDDGATLVSRFDIPVVQKNSTHLRAEAELHFKEKNFEIIGKFLNRENEISIPKTVHFLNKSKLKASLDLNHITGMLLFSYAGNQFYQKGVKDKKPKTAIYHCKVTKSLI